MEGGMSAHETFAGGATRRNTAARQPLSLGRAAARPEPEMVDTLLGQRRANRSARSSISCRRCWRRGTPAETRWPGVENMTAMSAFEVHPVSTPPFGPGVLGPITRDAGQALWDPDSRPWDPTRRRELQDEAGART